jgi:hypothetical protein
MSELYFAPTKKAQSITLQDLQQRLTAAGLSCKIEPDSPDTHWIVFDRFESTIYASTTDGRVTLATFNLGPDDEPTILVKIEGVMDSIGFSADEEADYA